MEARNVSPVPTNAVSAPQKHPAAHVLQAITSQVELARTVAVSAMHVTERTNAQVAQDHTTAITEFANFAP
jgi:hypothetical protein